MASPNRQQHADLEHMARERFGSLGALETKLLIATQKGQIAGPHEIGESPPTQVHERGTADEIRADLIRWLCVDREAILYVDPRGIQVHSAKITGTLDLSFVSAPFSLRLLQCQFANDVNLHFVELTALDLSRCSLPSLFASYARIRGTLALHGLEARGTVGLYAAHIDGNVECNGAKFRNPMRIGAANSGTALEAEGIKVGGHLFLCQGFLSEGEVRLFAAKIDGNLECDNGTFQNAPQDGLKDSGVALNVEQATVGGDVRLRNDFVSEGEVRLFAAKVGGNLDCDGGKFQIEANASDRIALNAESARVTGSVFFRKDFSASGHVRLYHAQIEKNFECVCGKFQSLDLTHASAVAIRDDTKSWPARGKLSIDGFTYHRIAYGPATADQRLEWLARHVPFSRRTYRQFAKVLRETGYEQDARLICAEMERRAWAERGWILQPISYLLRATIGYGYFSLRALWWLLGLFALGSLIYYQGFFAGSIVPTDKDAYSSFAANGEVPEYYQAFHATAYSLENSFPLVKLGVADKWAPGSRAQRPSQPRNWWTTPHFLLCFRWAQICIGWLLATLFVGGVTGIIRRE